MKTRTSIAQNTQKNSPLPTESANTMSTTPPNTPVAEDKYTHTVTFYSIQGENPWHHAAVKAGGMYISPYPATHQQSVTETVTPPVERDIVDVFREIQKGYGPMIRGPMVFGDRKAESKSEYEQTVVKVPVTEEEHKKVEEFNAHYIAQAEAGEIKYSVTPLLGDSCATYQRKVLETIVKGSPEEHVVKPSLLQKMIPWPQTNIKMAAALAHARSTSQLPVAHKQLDHAPLVRAQSSPALSSDTAKNPEKNSLFSRKGSFFRSFHDNFADHHKTKKVGYNNTPKGPGQSSN